jgi:signal transduction histidine kinase/DNA-binding NarL/FixJ family response regulator
MGNDDSKRIVHIGFGAALLIFLLIGVISYWSTKELIEVDKAVANALKVLHTLEVVETKLQNVIISQRDFIITGDKRDFDSYSTGSQIVSQKIKALRTLIGNTIVYQHNIDTLERLIEREFAALQEMLALHEAKGFGPAVQNILIDKVKSLMDEIRSMSNEIENEHTHILDRLRANSETSAHKTIIIIIIGNAIAFGLLFLSFSLLTRQINERRRLEESLKQAKEVSETANQAKSEFLAHMSHELRTPLNGILGYTQIFKRDSNLTEQQRNGIDIIHRSGEYLLTMINDILDLSKIEARKIELELAEFSLSASLRTLVEMTRIRAEQRGIAFVYEEVSGLPQIVYGDEKRLRQIILNLLGNAVKFTEKGSVTFRVGVNPRVHPIEGKHTGIAPTHIIRFEVEDTGIGIPPDKLHDIFEPFQRVSEQRFQIEGTGIGLTISQRIARMMGSEIHVKSTPGKGSTFWFELELPEVERDIVGEGEHSPTIVGFKGKSRKILIVDDDDDNRKVLKKVLLPLGFEIAEAVNGRDAITKAKEFHPDLVLMDLVMPVMNGFEATRRIRKIPDLKNIIVFAISANAFAHTRQESLEAGCHDFFAKPLHLESLLEKFGTYLHLEWVFEQGISSTESPTEQTAYVLPPANDLLVLLNAAKIGDILEIRNQIDHLEQINTVYLPFTTKIRELAKNFQIRQLRHLLETYLTEDSHDTSQ